MGSLFVYSHLLLKKHFNLRLFYTIFEPTVEHLIHWKNIAMKNQFSFLFSKLFLKHLGISLIIVIVLFITALISLRIYTNHGESYNVPDVNGLTESQLSNLIDQSDLQYQIIDSVHLNGITPGVVVEQIPKAGSKVKKDRTIFLTINALNPEKVLLPRLTDYSLRSAQVILSSHGLTIGKLIYIPSEYTNLVLGQHFQGKSIEPGEPVLKGSAIDLLVGRGLGSDLTSTPDLIGLTIEEATPYIQSISLNLGLIAYDANILSRQDSLSAFIYKQTPSPSSRPNIPIGSSIDLWVTIDSLKLNPSTNSTIQIK